MNVFTPVANAFRFYDDDAGEAASAPLAAQDTNITVNIDSGDVALQLRYRIQETGAISGAATDDYRLQRSVNGGAFADVNGSTAVAAAAAGLTNDGATTNRATNGIADGSGSFVAGEQSTDGLVDNSALTASNFTEHVWGLNVIAADVTDGDVVTFRVSLNGGAPGMTNSVTPTITIQQSIATKTGSDTPTVSVDEASTNLLTSAVSDTPTVGLTEAVTVTGFIAVSDPMSIGLVEAQADIGTNATSWDADTASWDSDSSEWDFVITEKAGTDTVTLSLTEAAVTIVLVAPSDTPTLTLTETIAVASSSAVSDTATLSLSEASTNLLTSGVVDTASVSVVEAKDLLVSVSPTDTAAVSLTETTAVTVVVSGTDAPALSVTEGTTDVRVLVTPSDTPTVGLTEASTNALTSSRADTVSIGCSDVLSLLFAQSDRADTISVGLTDAVLELLVLTTPSDTPAVSVDEFATVLVFAPATDLGLQNDYTVVGLIESAVIVADDWPPQDGLSKVWSKQGGGASGWTPQSSRNSNWS